MQDMIHVKYRKTEPDRVARTVEFRGEFLDLTQLQRDDNDIVPSASKASS